jgi:hypothetical protein
LRTALETDGCAKCVVSPGLDRELVPVDDRAIAVGHRQRIAGLAESRGSAHDRRIDRIGKRLPDHETGSHGGDATAQAGR